MTPLTPLLLALASSPLGPPPSAPRYDFVLLPTPTSPAGVTLGYALNSHGRVVGSGIESGWFHGYLWNDAGAPVDLSELLGWEASYAYGITDHGFVVGASAIDATTNKEAAFLAHPAIGSVFLPKLVDHPGIAAGATDMSENGLVVGYSDTAVSMSAPFRRAVLWKSLRAIDLGTLGGDLSSALAVNESATVVGNSNLQLGGLIRAFRWTPEHGMERLTGFSPGARTTASDVNEAGMISGTADGPPFRHAVVWSDPDTFRVLPEFPGDHYSEAGRINNHGDVVGRGISNEINGRLWKDGRVYDLDELIGDPDYDVFEATDINDRGQILALAFDTTGPQLVAVSLLLTPIP